MRIRCFACDSCLQKWFARPGTPNGEYVLQLPEKFYSHYHSRENAPAIHYGWYPVSALDNSLRARIEQTFRQAPPAATRAANIQWIKEKVKDLLAARRDPDLQEITISFESDQLCVLDNLETGGFQNFALR